MLFLCNFNVSDFPLGFYVFHFFSFLSHFIVRIYYTCLGLYFNLHLYDFVLCSVDVPLATVRLASCVTLLSSATVISLLSDMLVSPEIDLFLI